jgi:A/G-specific adenine glycosylase
LQQRESTTRSPQQKVIVVIMALDPQHKRQFQHRLQQWYFQHGRDLPWRRTTDAYAILVSEVMLQQTQVERVVDYYQRFLLRFPTIAALAAAPLEEVLTVWQGLGYYQRARHLHQAARYIMEQHQGVFPDTFAEVAALPGVGRYTAGAVLCFAFGQRLPILDTNVQRVLERVFVRRPAKRTSVMQKRLWRLAEEILPHGKNAWVINQAMMDLGATVCTARSPQCTQCSLQTVCHAAHSFTRQLGLFVYADADTTDLPRVAEAEAPYGKGGTPPPDFGRPSPPRKQRATNTRRT